MATSRKNVRGGQADLTVDRIAPPPSLHSFFQVGYVVPDLGKAVDFFTKRLGSGPFMVLEDAPVRDQTYHGAPCEPHQSLAFGYAGNLQFELIHPLAGSDPSTYTNFLDDHPRGGIHHTAVRVADIDAAVKDLDLGDDAVVQTGSFGVGTQYRYLDATADTGALLELIHMDDDTVAMFDRIRRGEI